LEKVFILASFISFLRRWTLTGIAIPFERFVQPSPVSAWRTALRLVHFFLLVLFVEQVLLQIARGFVALHVVLGDLEETRIALALLHNGDHVQSSVPVYIENGVIALQGLVCVFAKSCHDVPHHYTSVLAPRNELFSVRRDHMPHVVSLCFDAHLLGLDHLLVDSEHADCVVVGLHDQAVA